MRRTLLLSLFSIVFSGSALAATSQSDFLAQHGLAGKNTQQIVDAIDQNPQARPLPFSASITSSELKLSDGEQAYSFPLADKFYLSVAPYENQTHPCFNHSLSGCQGEMPNTAFDVKVTDQQGKVVLQKSVKSYQNGFIGLWLPRDMQGTLDISYQGKTASAPISTHSESQTCLTTVKL